MTFAAVVLALCAMLHAYRLTCQLQRTRTELTESYLVLASVVADRNRAERNGGRVASLAIGYLRTIEALHAERRCGDLDRYFDGELDTARAEAFQDHLAHCERCQRVLEGRMQEMAAATTERIS